MASVLLASESPSVMELLLSPCFLGGISLSCGVVDASMDGALFNEQCLLLWYEENADSEG